MNAFQLLVYAIAFAAFLWIFMAFISPIFFPAEDPVAKIGEGLDISELTPGQYVPYVIDLKADAGMDAALFDTSARSVIMHCNNPSVCCSLEGLLDECGGTERCGAYEKCRVALSNRNLVVLEETKARGAARCIPEFNLHVCRVYLGEEPAQVRLVEVGYDEEFDLEEEEAELKVSVKNTGNIAVSFYQAEIVLYKIEVKGGIEEKMRYGDSLLEVRELLLAGETEIFEFSTGISDNGAYEAEARVAAIDAGYEEKTIRFRVKGASPITEGCEAGSFIGIEEREGECREIYECKGCEFGWECREKWSEKGKSVELGYKDYAYVSRGSPAEGGICEGSGECYATQILGAEEFGDKCRKRHICVNCETAEECFSAWEYWEVEGLMIGSNDYAYAVTERFANGKCVDDEGGEEPGPDSPIGTGYGGLTINGFSLENKVKEFYDGHVRNKSAMLSKAAKYERVIQQIASEKGLGADLIRGIMARESAFNESITSSAGAIGLMQVMPYHFCNTNYPTVANYVKAQAAKGIITDCVKESDRTDPYINTSLGADIFKQYLKVMKTRQCEEARIVPLTIAAYNTGPGGSDKSKKSWRPMAECGLEGLPYAETKDYVPAVLGWAEILKGA